MTTTIIKKSFAFILILIGMFSTNTNAQIVYTNVSPDDTVTCITGSCSDIYNLDLNNDGIIDFQITSTNSSQGGTTSCTQRVRHSINIAPFNSNAIVFVDSASLFAAKLDSNKVIKNTSVWKNSSASLKKTTWVFESRIGCIAKNSGWSGSNSSQAQSGYVGLKLVKGNNTYYGWIQLNIYVTFGGSPNHSGRCVVIDYAYDSTPNHSIHAGATNGVRLSNNFITDDPSSPWSFKIAPNPLSHETSGSTNIFFSLSKSEKISLKIFDLNGRLLTTFPDNTFEPGEHQIEFNAEKLKAGIYILRVQSEDILDAKKLFIIN